MSEKLSFGKKSYSENPLDALHDAAAVVDMIKTFVAGSKDLSLFDDNERNDSMHGLYIVLGAVEDTIHRSCETLQNSNAKQHAAG